MDNTTILTVQQSPWKVIFLSPIIVLSLVAQLLLFCVIRGKPTLRHMSYYYLLSMGALHSTMAVISAPLEVFMEFTGEMEPYRSSCSIWVTLDTFFCNNIFLHLLGASLDAMLKTHNPFKYGYIPPRGTTILKLGAPWTISVVQSTAIFALSRRQSGLLEGFVCFLDDANFQVLRFLLTFVFPLLCGFIIYLISVLELSRYRSKTYLEDFDKTSEFRGLFRTPSMESLDAKSPDFDASTSQNSPGLISYTERIFTMKKGLQMYGDQVDDEEVPCECKRRKKRKRSKSDHLDDGADVIVELTSYHERTCPNYRSRFTGPHSLTQSTYIGLSDLESNCATTPTAAPSTEEQSQTLTNEIPPKSIRHRQLYLRRMLHTEEQLTKILAILYAVNAALWSPYIIGHLLRTTCTSCLLVMDNTIFRNFKWAAYFSCIFNPFIFMAVNKDIRRGYFDILRGRCR